MIQPNELISLFRQALNEKWGYIWGSAGETWTQAKQDSATREQTVKYGQKWVGRRVADCSGLFSWAYKQLGSYMYHGSNTMFKMYTTANGALSGGKRTDGQSLKPGTAVFKYNATDGYYHVGLYIGDDTVIEAKSTYAGVTTSAPSVWSHWGELKYIDYGNEGEESMALYKAKVTTDSGTLNVRKTASKTASVIGRLSKGMIVDVLQEQNGWLNVSSGSISGWCDGQYLMKLQEDTESTVGTRLEITDSEGNIFIPVGVFTVKVVKG